MKPRTYFGLSLLFPYILWGICALVITILPLRDASSAWDILLMPFMFYVAGVILWLIPYTMLAIGMWVLSTNRSTAALYRLAGFSTLVMCTLMLIEVVLVSLPVENFTELTNGLPGQMALTGTFSLVFGYLCVRMALGVYKILHAKRLIAEEKPESI